MNIVNVAKDMIMHICIYDHLCWSLYKAGLFYQCRWQKYIYYI